MLFELFLDGLLFAHLLQEVGFVGQQQRFLESVSHLLKSEILGLDLRVNQFLELSCLEVGELVQTNHSDVEVLERCHRSLKVCLQLANSTVFLMVLGFYLVKFGLNLIHLDDAERTLLDL